MAVKTSQLNIRVSDELKARIIAAAEADGRTPSNFVVHLLTQALDELERKNITA